MNITEYEAWKLTYCARCNSTVGVEESEHRGRFCSVCWKPAKYVPGALDRMIQDLIKERPGSPGQKEG